MSKMGQTIVEIEERFGHGQSINEIAHATRTSKSFVEGIVEDLNESYYGSVTQDEWYEYEESGS